MTTISWAPTVQVAESYSSIKAQFLPRGAQQRAVLYMMTVNGRPVASVRHSKLSAERQLGGLTLLAVPCALLHFISTFFSLSPQK